MSEFDNVNRLKKALAADSIDPWDAVLEYVSGIDKRVDALDKRVEALEKNMLDVQRGFPAHHKNGERDPRYHADWHERDIENYMDRKGIWKGLFAAALTAGVLAIGGGIWYLIQTGAKVEVARVVKEQGK